jgi:hypothetical protein
VSSATERWAEIPLVLPLQIEKLAMQITLQQQTSPLGKLESQFLCSKVLFRRFADQTNLAFRGQRLPATDERNPLGWFAVIQQSKYERRCTVNVEAYGYSAAPRFGCKHCGANTGQIEAQHI